MRPRRLLLPAAGLFVLAAAATTVAQQQPIHGCNAAPSCRPLGFSALDKNAGFGGLFVGVGARWGPGFTLFVAAPKEIVLTPAPVTGEIFHLGVSLLNPLAVPTPLSLPPPTPAPDR
jgi:hypothetical protein